jgi:hypothetical protein
MASDLVLPKAIYHRNEIPNADYLMSFQQKLRDEFLQGFRSLEQVSNYIGRPTLDRRGVGVPLEETEYLIKSKSQNSEEYETNIRGWLQVLFKYNRGEDNSPMNYKMSPQDGRALKYKTAYGLVQEFGEYCPIAHYSIMAPNTVLDRHTGPENRTGKYIRIHIPLIIPEGDVFLEVNGEEVTWNDLFGFNNQFVHSAHNYTNEYRLIFLIDLDREHIGMSPGEPYSEKFKELETIPFIRDKHKHE